MIKMKVLNLYAGIGGNRKLWDNVEVTAIEFNPAIAKIYQDFFPDDKMIVTDAHQYLLDHFLEYDFIWASPPCPSHSRVYRATAGITKQNPIIYVDMRLYQEILLLQTYFDGLWCIENVRTYYNPLIKPQEVGLHYFWANFIIRAKNYASRSHTASIKELEKVKGFDLSSYNGIDKRQVLRNCIKPDLGKIVLDSARGNTQKTLAESVNSKRVRIDPK